MRHSLELFYELAEIDLDLVNLTIATVTNDQSSVLDLPEDLRAVAVAANVEEVRHLFAFECLQSSVHRLNPSLCIARPLVDRVEAPDRRASRLL